MENLFVLLLIGVGVGALGTLIGAGGGFMLVPLLLFSHPHLQPDVITAVSIAVVAANAISGSISYSFSKRIDYKSGLLFAFFTIPGSIMGVYLTAYIPKTTFHTIFGLLLITISIFLFIAKKKKNKKQKTQTEINQNPSHTIIDSHGNIYLYDYSKYAGVFISIIIGFLSPLLGIGGGIIHVPALVNWLNFPVYVATATSHFILAIMSTVSVITHIFQGNYDDPVILKMVICLSIGAVVGAQIGAKLSHQIKGNFILQLLAICLIFTGIRLLFH